MSKLCLTLLCPPEVGEKLLDLLLLLPNARVFSSSARAAHGVAQEYLDEREQVLGWARTTEVRALIESDEVAALLETLRKQFAGVGIRYWTMPVVESGDIA